MVIETIATIGGASHARGHVVSDARGNEILAEHPQAATRVPHDEDLCAVMIDMKCDHDSHDWNYTKPSATRALASVPSPEVKE